VVVVVVVVHEGCCVDATGRTGIAVAAFALNLLNNVWTEIDYKHDV
jgi:hypothetical protein